MAALGGTAQREPYYSTPCCPDRKDGRKDESRLWKQDCVPGKMLYQGCPSGDRLSLRLHHLLSISP